LEDEIFNEFKCSSDYTKEKLIYLVGGNRVIDLLLFSPIEYITFSLLQNKTNKPEGVEVVVDVLILNHEPSFKISSKNPYKINAEFDDGNSLVISFFAGNASMWKAMFKENSKYKIACKLQKFGSVYYAVHPKIVKLTQSDLVKEGAILEPKYSLTGNLNQSTIKNIIQKHLKFITNFKSDWCNDDFLNLQDAITQLHSPKTLEDAEKARTRLAFDELIAKNLAFYLANLSVRSEVSPSIKYNPSFLKKALNILPFGLTQDQESSLNQIIKLQEEEVQNTVLLQGDVGSGKTIVAILCAINVALSGLQVAVMSPTFILASQTFLSFVEIADIFGIEVLFFSGDDKGKKRAEKLMKIKTNQAKIIIGTHALFSSDVEFHRLGYAIIDEQHRFGINQRLALSTKSLGVKTMLMTATPIPRTLRMALFGDIEIAYLKEKPKNRKEIITKLFSKNKIPEIVEAIKRKINNGEQIYWVVPFIDEAEDESKERSGTSIEIRQKSLNEHFTKEQIGVIHGRMKEAEINQIMQRFKSREISLILATTVIEVGVNVPNATVMVIESAENFGLSTLHQLRGRVGRGDLQSYCFLITSANGGVNFNKLKILTASNDGFFIAEKDMEIRGSGAILSKMQSGFEGFNFVKLERDTDLVKLAKKYAKDIFNRDPNLETKEGLALKTLLRFYNYDYLIQYRKA
jgi:ATP-dependent DNA helicase RecG